MRGAHFCVTCLNTISQRSTRFWRSWFAVWLWSREPKKVLSILNSLSQDYIGAANFTGSKDCVTGVALWMDDRRAAALNAWRAARRVVEQRLAAQPGLAWVNAANCSTK